MTNLSQENPISRIVDTDTFCLYVADYRKGILANPPHTKNNEGWRSIQRIAENNPGAQFSVDRLLSQVYIENCPWDELPESMRTIIQYSYDVAAIAGEKSVDITITERSLSMDLNSPFIEDLQLDTYGENRVIAVELVLEDFLEYGRKKGQWESAKMSEADFQRGELAVQQHTEQATLNQLQEVATFLEKHKDRASAFTRA